MSDFVNLPPITISKDLIERVQFSLSSRNAENKVAECAVHVFASKSVEDLQEIDWQYVASGVPCMLRNRELHKNGRKYVWSMSLCLYDAHYGVLVWKSKLLPNSDYTAVADNFHVFALGEVNVVIGMLFSSKEQACELNTTYNTWHQERQRDDGKKGPISSGAQATRFRKEMISKPCNFQHIQGTQALDECLEIEKRKADIIAALFGLGTKAGRSEPDGAPPKKRTSNSKRGRLEITRPKMSFKMISIPRTSLNTPPVSPPPLSSPTSATVPSAAHEELHSTQMVQYQATVDVANGYQDNSDVFVPPAQTYTPPNLVTDNYNLSDPQPMTPDYNQAGTGNFAATIESSGNSQGSQPSAYDKLESSGVYNQLEPDTAVFYNTSQGSFGYNNSPPRLDLNLEKEFSESVLFQSPLMTAN